MAIDVYDLLIIGGGSAGSAAAGEAVKRGAKKVGLINDGELGGLCILRGCMPTKTLLYSTELIHHFRHSEEIGVKVGGYTFDFPHIMDRKRKLVARFQRAKVSSIENGGYEVIDGRGNFVSETEVEVNGKRLQARAFLIATGSRLFVPPIPGIDTIDYLDSDQVLTLEKPPTSLAIQGAGPIALEFATFFSALGVEVTLINRSPILRQGEAPDLSQQYQNMMEDQGVTVYAPAKTVEVKKVDGSIATTIEVGGELVTVNTEAFLLATGRVANLEGLALDAAGVEVDGTTVKTNEYLQTTNPKIFVAGDATNSELILHVGNMEGRHVARNAVALASGNELTPWKNEIPMSVNFSDHPYAEAGLTEKEAKDQGLNVITSQKNWANQGRGIVMNTRPDQGFIKLIARKDNGRLVGGQILGPRADDLIHVVSTVLFYKGTVMDMVKMPWYHPTLSEGFIEMARNLAGQVDGG